MTTLRAFFRDHRRLAALLVTMASCMKVVPGGYMPVQQGKVLTVAICADATGGKFTQHIVVPTNGKAGEHAKSEETCP